MRLRTWAASGGGAGRERGAGIANKPARATVLQCFLDFVGSNRMRESSFGRWSTVLGLALIGILILSVGGKASQPQSKNGQCTCNDCEIDVKQNEGFFELLVHDPVAFFTAVLASLTLILAIVGVFQIIYLNRADKTARLAAEAAKASADALQVSERANVIEKLEGTMNMDSLYRSGESFPNSPSMETAPQPVAIGTTAFFKNYGKTPAIILSYSIEPFISEEIPRFSSDALVAVDFQTKRLVDYVIEAQGSTEEIPISRVVPTSWSQSNLLASRKLNVWFVGHVTYIDVFDTVRTREFAWLYDRPMRQFVPSSAKSRIEKKS